VSRRNRPLTASDIRAQLAATAKPVDVLHPRLPQEFERWPEELRRTIGSEYKPAGVLIPIIDRGEALSVLLTRRAAHLRYHPGQVAFPGGRMERQDADITATALREAHEEVGIPPENVEIAGCLEPTLTITGYTVTPVVGLIPPTVRLVIDRTEVERAFEVPLAFLLDEANAHRSFREYQGVRLPVVEFNFASERIWGATANIVMTLRQTLAEPE
jgi:8-oxo-dGTP pyrophosphatase MutT (NUDIX family)